MRHGEVNGAFFSTQRMVSQDVTNAYLLADSD
jgi:hypothetical protein